MTTEDAIREELVGLLTYANKTAIGEALGVSAQTDINWSEGKYPSQRRLDQVRALYGLPVTSGHAGTPPLQVEERLGQRCCSKTDATDYSPQGPPRSWLRPICCSGTWRTS